VPVLDVSAQQLEKLERDSVYWSVWPTCAMPRRRQTAWDRALSGSTSAPHPAGWRAAIRPAATLPHYPVVLHRGGYADGS
jgi:hypothetical protein